MTALNSIPTGEMSDHENLPDVTMESAAQDGHEVVTDMMDDDSTIERDLEEKHNYDINAI
jgi:hypothetical protein